MPEMPEAPEALRNCQEKDLSSNLAKVIFPAWFFFFVFIEPVTEPVKSRELSSVFFYKNVKIDGV